MCDKRLPTGVALPEMNHDWNTLTLEEIRIGQRAIMKINKSGLIHPYLLPYKKMGWQEVCVQIIAADNRSNSVLVLF
jgi:other hect domain ubiquitin protein ligase E3